jgi:arsenic resistance protein ArsH
LAIPADEDEKNLRDQYRPFLLPDEVANNDWVSKLELSTALQMAEADIKRTGGDRLKVLVLYGSLRSRYVLVVRDMIPNQLLIFQVIFPLVSI